MKNKINEIYDQHKKDKFVERINLKIKYKEKNGFY